MAHEQPLPEFFRRSGDEELVSVMQGVLKSARLRLVEVPATAASPGVFGDIAIESGAVYFCVAKDTWESVAIATF